MTNQTEELEQGELNFTNERDISLLQSLNRLIELYGQYKSENSPTMPIYDFFEKVNSLAYLIRFDREEFSNAYRAAIEAETLKVLQAVGQKPSDPAAEKRHKDLIEMLISSKDKLQRMKETLALSKDTFLTEKTVPDAYIERLYQNPNDWLYQNPKTMRVNFSKEIGFIREKLQKDIAFIEKQIASLVAKESVGMWGRWTIYSHDKRITHNVRQVKEMEVDKPAGWGQKLLTMGLWGLYLSPQIGSLVQFGKLAHQAYTTGKSSELRQAADLMSEAAFVKKLSELPAEDLLQTEFDSSIIHGVLGGYLPNDLSLQDTHPAAADYLKTVPNEVQAGQTGVVSTNAPISTPVIATKEAAEHAHRFIGQQVKEHYRAAGKQIEWEHPHHSFSWDKLGIAEEKPKTMFALYGEECTQAIREAKNGVPIEENANFNFLQKQLFDTFGTNLPTGWFEKWLVGQEWNEARLEDFQQWFSGNLELQVRDFIRDRDIHEKKDAPQTIPFTLSSEKSFQDQNSIEVTQDEFNETSEKKNLYH